AARGPMCAELWFARRGEPVVLRLAIVVRGSPLGFQLAVLLEAIERWKERARVDLEIVVAERRQALSDAVAVQRLPGENREDHQIERALRDIEFFHRTAPLG